MVSSLEVLTPASPGTHDSIVAQCPRAGKSWATESQLSPTLPHNHMIGTTALDP